MKVQLAFILFVGLVAGCERFRWKEFSSAEGGFSALFPSTPAEHSQKINTQAGAIELHLIGAEQSGREYMVAYNDYPQTLIETSHPGKVLDGARDGAVGNLRGRLLKETQISLEQYPGRELTIRVPDGGRLMQTRIYIVKNRLYQVGVVTSEEAAGSKETGKFLDSFKLLKN